MAMVVAMPMVIHGGDGGGEDGDNNGDVDADGDAWRC